MSWSVIVFLVLCLLFNFIFLAMFRAMRKGYFSVMAESANAFCFKTDFGIFKISHSDKSLTHIGQNGKKVIKLEDVASVKFAYDERWAVLAEFFFGFDLMDLFSPYRDRIHWYTVKLRLKDNSELPLFVAGEYEPREFLLGWALNLEARILSAMGLLKDVPSYARNILNSLLKELGKSGIGLK
jgi:hypothetical protein